MHRHSKAARIALGAALALAVAAALLAVSGCGLLPGAGSPLDGTSWRLTGWSLSSLDPAAFTITASFADGRISGTSAVNSYGGSYRAGPGSAFSVGELAMTEMAGPEPAMRAETAYLTLLRQARTYRVEAGVLRLYDAGGNESLFFGPAGK
jgi:heat shock protein HslJ